MNRREIASIRSARLRSTIFQDFIAVQTEREVEHNIEEHEDGTFTWIQVHRNSDDADTDPGAFLFRKEQRIYSEPYFLASESPYELANLHSL